MFRLVKISALALLLSVATAIQASAATIQDPIVRTRTGATGSIPITGLPFFFDWGEFPGLPPGFDPPDCDTGFEGSLNLVTCEFVNQTGQTINFLDFDFDYGSGGPPPLSAFDIQDGNTPFNSVGWNTLNINQFSAQFIGNGIAPEICDVDCFGGHFFVDLVGFPDGTRITMTAAAEPVPEPMTLTLLGTGLALGAAARRRTKKEGRRTKG